MLHIYDKRKSFSLTWFFVLTTNCNWTHRTQPTNVIPHCNGPPTGTDTPRSYRRQWMVAPLTTRARQIVTRLTWDQTFYYIKLKYLFHPNARQPEPRVDPATRRVPPSPCPLRGMLICLFSSLILFFWLFPSRKCWGLVGKAL